MFLKIGVLKNLQFYQKKSPVQVLSCKFPKFLRTSFFTEHLRWLLLSFLKKSKSEKIHSHKYINRKTPEIVSFLLKLQASGLTVLRKRDYILDFFYVICDVLLNFIFTEDSWATASDFQQRFEHIIYTSSNKST